MSVQQNKNFRILKAFFKQLRHFGLNPRDWKIERGHGGSDLIRFYHRGDGNFRFNGLILRKENGELYLRHLALVSL